MSKFWKMVFNVCVGCGMLIAFTPLTHGQWKEVAQGVVTAPQQHVGALRFRDGVAWAGTVGVSYSLDTGLTWNSVPNLAFTNGITDIAIYDKLHILVSTDQDGLFLSSDGGNNWTNLTPDDQESFTQCSFDSSSSVLLALSTGEFYSSTDAGATWNSSAVTQSFEENSLCFAIDKNNTIYVQSNTIDQGDVGWLNISTDLGRTWDGNTTTTDGDCETLSADSCVAGKLYLVNENVAVNDNPPFQKHSHIDVTTNKGQNWKTTSSFAEDFYNGSLASTSDVLYVGTYYVGGTGVVRSTDFGTTWNSIGGPFEQFDTRTIAAVNDNIVLVLDENGNVWRTLNSGGFPLTPTFSVAPMALFQTDTISCDSVERTVQISTPNCSSISSIAFLGDTVSYRLASTGADSASVIFASQVEGAHQGKMVIMLSNGAADTIDLGGTVSPSSTALSVVSANVHTDTLGGTVSVPIAINGLPHAENIDLILHYQGSVQYLGSFSKTGTKLDVPGPILYGRSVLQINGATSGVTLGYAMFNVFNDSNAVSFATFDSMTVLTAISTCEYSLGTPVIDTITPLFGCGITMLSQWIHLDQTPLFSIIPNPATNGQVWMTASDDLGAATVAIYDMLGAERAEWQASIEKNVPIECALPEASGIYTIVVHSASGTQSMRMVRE